MWPPSTIIDTWARITGCKVKMEKLKKTVWSGLEWRPTGLRLLTTVNTRSFLTGVNSKKNNRLLVLILLRTD